jgi:hypothetical protein
VDTLERWWQERKAIYPHVQTLMIDLDNGPDVSERLKGASAGRFKRGQFDRKGTFDLDGRFHQEPGIGVGVWHASWQWIKSWELSS